MTETELQEIEKRWKFVMTNVNAGEAVFILIEDDIPALLSTVRELQRQIQELCKEKEGS